VLLTTIEVLSGLRAMDRVINRRRRRFSCRIAVVVVASLALVPPGAVVVALTLVAFLVPVFLLIIASNDDSDDGGEFSSPQQRQGSREERRAGLTGHLRSRDSAWNEPDNDHVSGRKDGQQPARLAATSAHISPFAGGGKLKCRTGKWRTTAAVLVILFAISVRHVAYRPTM